MKRSWSQMGMPITLELIGPATADDFTAVHDWFDHVDRTFSTYKNDSVISRINAGMPIEESSTEVQAVLQLCDETKAATDGYFDVHRPDGSIDPSGLVKGWAIQNAAELLIERGHHDFCLEVGGDIAAVGHNAAGDPWRVGLRNPLDGTQIVKVVAASDHGVATSGTAERGQHIYNPHQPAKLISDVLSLTVIGPNIYEADRFATAAFAMGRSGIDFIEHLDGFEGYQIDADGVATLTSNFDRYVVNS